MAILHDAKTRERTGIEQQETAIQKQKEQATRAKKLTQLTEWVNGNSIHMQIDGNLHCCPDMSCCFPKLHAPKPFRKLFLSTFVSHESRSDKDIKSQLYNTFTQYLCEANNWSYSTGKDIRYYTDWLKDTHHFDFDDKCFIRFHMWRMGVKY